MGAQNSGGIRRASGPCAIAGRQAHLVLGRRLLRRSRAWRQTGAGCGDVCGRCAFRACCHTEVMVGAPLPPLLFTYRGGNSYFQGLLQVTIGYRQAEWPKRQRRRKKKRGRGGGGGGPGLLNRGRRNKQRGTGFLCFKSREQSRAKP